MSVASEEQRLHRFLSTRPGLHLAEPEQSAHPLAWRLALKPASADQIAERLLADAEFKALGISRWLVSAEGTAIARLVVGAMPTTYRSGGMLLVEGLKLAAEIERQRGEKRAGQVALGVIGAAVAVAFLLAAGKRSWR